jgi:hypothetical protein
VVKAFLYREASPYTEELDTALAKAQGEFLPVVRNKQGPYGMFADLLSMEKATRPALSKYQLATKQYFLTHENNSMTLITELSHKGQWCVSGIPIPFFSNPQHTHSYVTYMARLGYARILTLAVDDGSDNDGQNLTQSDSPAPDLLAITTAVSQAVNTKRLDQLWKAVLELNLKPEALNEVEKAFDAQHEKLEKSNKENSNKGGKPNADSK